MKQHTIIIIFTIIALSAVAISLLAYFISHSKKHEFAPISTLNTTTISNGSNNSQVTNSFTTKTNQFNNPTTSTSYAVKDSTSNTLITASTKNAQIQSTFQTTNIDTTGQKIITSGNAQTSIFITSTMKSSLYTTLASSTKQDVGTTDTNQLTMTNKQDGIISTNQNTAGTIGIVETITELMNITMGQTAVVSSTSLTGVTTTTVKADMSTTMGIASTQVTNNPSFMQITSTMMNNHVQTSTSTQSVFWNMDQPLNIGRSIFGSALLANGQVLVAGGYTNTSSGISQTEVYTSTGWQFATSMNAPRSNHTVTAFANNTKVLAVGGNSTSGFQTAEVYDIVNNTWIFTSTNMSSPRIRHTATLLGNGQILIAGGSNVLGISISAAELYIPSSNSFINTTNMNTERRSFTSTLLSDRSTVLVTAGANAAGTLLKTAELYINGSWILLPSIMTQHRSHHAAVLLNDGTVLIAGGGSSTPNAYSNAEIYDPTTQQFTAVGSMQYRRAALTLTLLPSGKVLATGGGDWTAGAYPLVCELYDPVTRTWSNTTMLNYGRSYHQTVLLNNYVLTTGGYDGNNRIATSEKYNL
ncbi:unnamed protein product [Adineta steineri]|uniref:Kelch repeat protein n=1 Tax=Adineta steineri TaxID=433720 RepID=A0A813YWL0_9BILA|nr:unnamed protein product [Adineta steineri]CAF1165607.1 unnamed protein product [Adineta steineri]